MKNICKNLLSLFLALMLLAACFAGFGITASADDGVLEISGLGDWYEFMTVGGRARLTADLEVDYLNTMGSSEDDTYILDLCGHALSCAHFTGIDENVTFICVSSGSSGSVSLTQGLDNRGTFALMNTTLICSSDDRYGSRCENDGTMILYDAEISQGDSDGLINFGTVMQLDLGGASITEDEFIVFISAPMSLSPVRSGYIFCGWIYDNGKPVIDFSALSGYVSVSAAWSAAVTVTFDARGGECDVESAMPDAGLTLRTLPAATKAGVCFDGWLLPDGSKVTTDTVFIENTTVTANWVPETEKADELADAMEELGFSDSRIEDFTAQLSGGEEDASTASVFLQPNVELCISLAAVLVAAAALIIVIVNKKKGSQKETGL